jgi:TetR/AcrR family transcriptional regulator, cholesterol catabolism regulator
LSDTQDSKEKLFRTAINLFSTKGFRGTSIRDIAQAMGMSISNIYHYYGNKEGLLLAILEYSSRNLVEELRRVAEQDVEPLEGFKKLVEAHILLSEYYRKEAKIFFLDEEHLSEEGSVVNRRIQGEILRIYRKQLRSLQEAGYVKDRKITVLAFNILGVINWQLRWYHPDGPLTLQEIMDEVLSFILYGLLGQKT